MGCRRCLAAPTGAGMLVSILIFTIAAILVAVVFQPRLIYILVWPVLFLYPHQYWAMVSPLPINIGFDDLFVVFCGAVAFLRLGGQPGGLRSWPMKVALSWLIMVFICDVAGLIRLPRGDVLLLHVQDVLKLTGFCLLIYALIKTIQTKQDLYRCIGSMVFSIFLAAFLIVLATRNPLVATIFLPGKYAEEVAAGVEAGYVVRVGGTLGSSNSAAVIIALCMCFVLLMISQSRSTLGKIVFVAGAVVMVVAVMATQGRSGTTGLLAIVIMLPFLRGMRKWGIAAVAIMVLVASTMPATYMPLVRRIYESFATQFGQLPYGVTVRFDIWKTYLRSFDLLDVVLGQGEIVSMTMAKRVWIDVGLPHSGYLDLVAFFGVWGVLWMGVVVRGLLKRSAVLRQSEDLDLQRIGRTVALYLVVLAVCGLTTDLFQTRGYNVLLLLVLLVFVDRAVLLASEQTETQYAWSAETPWPAYPEAPWAGGVARA